MATCSTCSGTRRVTDERDGKVMAQACPDCAEPVKGKIGPAVLLSISDALVTEAMSARGTPRGEAYAKACLKAATALEQAAGVAAIREFEARASAGAA